ncbi:Receptor-type tyrosine-protein phosphatase S [Bagarius yarrelli]|uniref:Thromboxane A2 receptor n=1 Tax=Bagarius yarrelli TaxID=175774 RepID=A0A556TS70_BAGYA|nr:Receptor-type tyrosine-protein phosphatase S [Bagarius yarrelli]
MLLCVSSLLLSPLLGGSLALSPPRFTKVPVDMIGVSGGVVSFVCQATGDPKPRVTWNKKGKRVNSQRIETIEFDEGAGAVLRIQPLRAPRDENIYECVAENSEGEVSVQAKLTIIREDLLPPGFPNIDMGPQLKVVERTRTANMLCAASGNPDPEITWFKDFLPIDPSTSNGRIKQLRSVRRVPPRFSILPTNHEIMPGGSINITCVAVGSPMPYVKWMLNSEDLTPEDDMPVGRNVLELNSVHESANYTCVAMSSLGIIEAVSQVIVKSLPKPPGTPVVTETTATSITITWDSGNPEPVSYYIIQYRAKIPDSKFETMDSITTTRYSIGGLSPNTEYEIRVSAVNTIGQGPASEPVEARTGEQAPASPPRNIQARIISHSTMMVRWEEPEEPNGQIKGYRVYYTMDPSQPMNMWQIHNVQDSMITTIQNLVASETYTIRVLAFTSVGDGPFSDSIHVKVLQGAPLYHDVTLNCFLVPGQPSKFQTGEVSDTSIELTWEPAFDKEGIINYELRYREGSQGSQITKSFGPTSSYVVEGLRANTEYFFTLAAISNKGIGAFTNEISQKTSQAKPSAPPQEVKCSSPSSTSLLVSWRPPHLESQNGPLVGYIVRYAVAGGGAGLGVGAETMEELQAPATSTEITLQRLEKWTTYRVSVAAATAVGAGPETVALTCRTDEDVPSAPPRRVEVEVINSTALKVMWRSLLPGRQHGQIRGYQVHYVRVENGEARGLPHIKDVMLADAQEMVIGGLQPDTTYSITVAAYTIKGDGARSKPKLVVMCLKSNTQTHTESRSMPGPPFLWVQQDSKSSAVVRWLPPELLAPGLELLGYRLQFGRKDVPPLATLEFAPYEREFSVSSMHRGATYVFRISAKTRTGFGDEAKQELSLDEEAPQGYPHLSDASNITCCSVHFSWLPPLLAERNGAITEYTLAYQEVGTASMPLELRLPATEHSYTLNNLKPDAVYDVKIRAHTSVGPGPYSPSVQYHTVALIKDVPKNFTVKLVTKTTVLLAWKFSDSRSPYRCMIEYNRQKVDTDARMTKALITNLRANSTYEFRVTCLDSGEGGPRHRLVARTAPAILNIKPELDVRREPENTVTLILPPLETRDIIKSVYVVVVPLKKGRVPNRHIKSPEEMDLEELLRDGNVKQRHTRTTRQLRQVDVKKPYITASFKPNAMPPTFMLGNQMVYNGFENRALEPGHDYVFFILAELNSTSTKMLVASPYSDSIMAPDVDPQPVDTGGDGLIWVVGPVLAVVFIICIVIAILLYKNFLCSAFNCVSLSADAGMMNHPPIPITELAEHTELLKANDNLKLSQEYESIDPGQQFTWEHSNLEVNKPKNRYANVIAYDHSRVILAPIDGIAGSDYINANYIDGYRKQNAYIATQGPLPETFGDFWRMVWEQRAATVVMMTRLEEKSRIKCDQYWPSRGTETYGMTQVTLLDTIELATFCVRTFSLHKNGSSEKREVRQFQFTAWPDHGVPEYPTPFLAFLRRVKTCNPPDAGPIIAHCSAGVGRTGCFIVIDAMLERIKHEKTVDIYGHVTLMRAQRNYMVQTEDQYSFIHDALLEAVACGNTEVPARSLFSYIQKLAQVEVGEHVTGMELEFKRLANSKAHTSRFISANLPCNKFKNRLVNIMPYETTRVCLQPIRGLEGSDYINASFIDGYSAGVGRTGVFITLSIVLERMRYEGVVDIFQTVKMLRTQRPAMVQTEDEYQFCYQAALEYLGSFDHYATPPLAVNHTITSAYFSAVFCVLGLSSNLFAFVVLVKSFLRTQSRSRSSFLLFLGGLVVTDFMGLLVTGAIVVSYHITGFSWIDLDPHCHFCNFMGMSMVFYGLCPLLLSATMAVERFVGITLPFFRSTIMSKCRVCVTVASVWGVAGVISVLPLLGLGSYHLQVPGSWCFLNISSFPRDMAFCLVFSLVGLTSLAVSFILNTVSVVTLLRVCCGQDSSQRRRDYEVEMMVQLILIMVIASICWYPLLVFTAQTVLSSSKLDIPRLLLYIRFATCNQILDPWVYILFRRSVLKRVYPRKDWSRGSIVSLYPSLATSLRRLTRDLIANHGSPTVQISKEPKQEDGLLSKHRVSSA